MQVLLHGNKSRCATGFGTGPLLFLLYINDLPVNIQDANLVMFADDINVLISGSEEILHQTKIDRVAAELETWFKRNHLVINTEKKQQ